jgi:hypothetical protein
MNQLDQHIIESLCSLSPEGKEMARGILGPSTALLTDLEKEKLERKNEIQKGLLHMMNYKHRKR